MPNAQEQRWLVERVHHPKLPLLVASDEAGVLRAIVLHADAERLKQRARAVGDTMLQERPSGANSPSVAALQLGEFLAGRRQHFELTLDPHGTPFEKKVWGSVARIEWGDTRSYGQLAHELGRPGAARAVGRANGANPLPLVIPCHRVIGQSGSLTGFAGGLATKAWLLGREGGQLGLFGAQPELPGKLPGEFGGESRG